MLINLRQSTHVDAATPWLRTKSLFAGIFIYGRRVFGNAGVETPAEFSNNFAAHQSRDAGGHQKASTLKQGGRRREVGRGV